MINTNFHKQYFQQFSSWYIVPQHKNPREKSNSKRIDGQKTQTKLEIQEKDLY